MKNCPVCRVKLGSTTVGGVTVDGCSRCGGVWFDTAELTQMAGKELTHLAAVDVAFEAVPGVVSVESVPGPCPTCGEPLVEFEPPQAPGLRLHRCARGHGVWLREDDFEKVIERVEQWRAQRAAAARSSKPATRAALRPAAPARERLGEIARGLLSRHCGRCRQPNAADAPVCWACGAILREEETLLHCPRCFDVMDPLSVDGVALNQCRICGYLWLNAGELGALIRLPPATLADLEAASLAARRAPAPPPSLPCPACDGELRQREYAAESGVLIHACDSCKGVWISPAALLPIQKFVEANERFLPPAEGTGL